MAPATERGRGRVALLLAAHGEQRAGAANDSVVRLAASLAACKVADEIGVGFVKDRPTVGEAMEAFTASDIVVYPLFMSSGYFVGTRLKTLCADAAATRPELAVRILPPLGRESSLAAVVADRADAAARRLGQASVDTTVVLMAHGSTQDQASYIATTELADRLRKLQRFSDVEAVFLEQPPTLTDVLSRQSGPVVVVGLFVGDGLHGGEDVARLIAALQRSDIVFAGNVGTWPEIAGIVAAAVASAAR